MSGGFVVSGLAQPLKLLEPVDDTIERIADVVISPMFCSGVLAVAMGPVGAVGFAMMAGAFTFSWLMPGRVLGLRLAAYGAFLGVALPLSFLLSSTIPERMTAEVWDGNSQVISSTTPISTRRIRRPMPDGGLPCEAA